jgi:hypothetical protein
MLEQDDQKPASPGSERERQEREVALSHALTRAEYALAREGAHVGRALESAGLEFDATTFVAVRVLETSVAENMDPADVFASSELRELIQRSAELTSGLLAGSASD